MRAYQTKVNKTGLPDSIAVTKQGAGEFNSLALEGRTAVESSGQIPAPADGTAEETDQLAKAMAIYGSGGDAYIDSGAAGAYVLTPIGTKLAPPAYFDGMVVTFKAGNNNPGASTGNVDAIGVVPIVMPDGSATPADVINTDGVNACRYDSSLVSFVLLSTAANNSFDDTNVPFTATNTQIAIELASATSETSKIQPYDASVSGNDLTCTLGATALSFRSATLGDGTVNTRIISSQLSITVPDGATLGTVNSVESEIVTVCMDVSPSVQELAVINIAGGNDLSERGVISTTAIDTGSDLNNVFYSDTARANVPYRVVGSEVSTQAVAGTWATGPSNVQGAGGNALSAMSSVGYGQKWQDVTGSRSLGTTFYNTTGKPIFVKVRGTSTASTASIVTTVDGVSFPHQGQSLAGTHAYGWTLVPPGSSYSSTFTSGTLTLWQELR